MKYSQTQKENIANSVFSPSTDTISTLPNGILERNFLSFHFKMWIIFGPVNLPISWKWLKTCKYTSKVLIWTFVSFFCFFSHLFGILSFNSKCLYWSKQRTVVESLHLCREGGYRGKRDGKLYAYILIKTQMWPLYVIIQYSYKFLKIIIHSIIQHTNQNLSGIRTNSASISHAKQ